MPTDRFSMLPEWAPQQAVLLAWPHACTDWKPWLEAIETDYVALASAIAKEAHPLILCQDQAHKAHIQGLLEGQCEWAPVFQIQPYNDTWCRDYGPITVAQNHNPNHLRLLDFRFNGWGDKYNASLDNEINARLNSLWQTELTTIDFELEGGSIETDGQGTLLTTRHCLLESNRNQQYSEQDIETTVLETLGLNRTLWLSQGALLGDDTDSHIDNLARFANESTLVYAICTNPDDPHYPHLQAMEKELQAFKQTNGEPYRLVAIEIPPAQINEEGSRLPASYINFLILNQSVIVPVFQCDQDTVALTQLQACFPKHNIVPVPGNNLIRQFGGPHCATMQLPCGTIELTQE